MKIAIDGYEANVEHRVGIGRYAYEIIKHLYFLVKLHDVTVFLPNKPRADMPLETERWQYKIVGPTKLWTFIGLPLALLGKSFDVVFSPTHYIPRFINIPRVMAIMDVSYLSYPELFRPGDLHKLTKWTEYSASHAAKIITISEFSKNAIIKAYQVPQNKVVVAYPGFTMNEKSTSMTVLKKPYILSVGTLQPRKNFVRLIEAFSRISNKTTDLVIVGKKGWLYEEILMAPKKYGVENRVRFMDFVNDEQLPSFYKNAECFVLPSLYEGFGLPVLEAMSYGIPVVVSNTSSLPEIAGEAGKYVDPESVESIKLGIEEVLDETQEKRIKRLNLGKSRVKEFTWEKAAQKVMGAIEEVYENAH